MFVPIGLLIQQEQILKDGADMVKALDRWVLKTYPNFTTSNPHMTKVQCLGVLHSFYAAGKLHFAVKPAEVDQAVNAFMEDRLWVTPETLSGLEVFMSQKPEYWLRQPNVLSCVRAGFEVWLDTVKTTFALVRLAIGTVIHLFIPRKPFKLPEKEASQLTSVKNS